MGRICCVCLIPPMTERRCTLPIENLPPTLGSPTPISDLARRSSLLCACTQPIHTAAGQPGRTRCAQHAPWPDRLPAQRLVRLVPPEWGSAPANRVQLPVWGSPLGPTRRYRGVDRGRTARPRRPTPGSGPPGFQGSVTSDSTYAKSHSPRFAAIWSGVWTHTIVRPPPLWWTLAYGPRGVVG